MPKQPKVTYYPIKTMYGETWCRNRVQKNLHSRIFLRSGQACTLPPGVARESRNDQCQYQYQMQFTRTCSMTSVRHVLFPEHSRKSRPALFPPISLILIKSSRHTRKLISAQNRFNQSSCVKDRRLVRLYVLLCHRENIMHRHLSSLVRLNSKTCRFTLST